MLEKEKKRKTIAAVTMNSEIKQLERTEMNVTETLCRCFRNILVLLDSKDLISGVPSFLFQIV